jgi:hypothetical protein
VMDAVEKGYLLNDKVIRFAKVVVGSWNHILSHWTNTNFQDHQSCQRKEIFTKY